MAKKYSESDRLINKAGNAYYEKQYEEAAKLYSKCLKKGFRMDAALGYGLSCVALGNFKEGLAVLEPARTSGRFQFRKYVLLLAGYCHVSLQQLKQAEECYNIYTGYLVNGHDENGTDYDDDPDFSYDDVDPFDPMEDDPDDFYDEDEDNEDEPEDEIVAPYKEYMWIFKSDLVEMPLVIEAWADYLNGNKEWLSDDQPYKWRIGNIAENFAALLIRKQYDSKASPEEITTSRRVGMYLYDLAMLYHPKLKEGILYAIATEELKSDRESALNRMREIVVEFPDHTNALHFLSLTALREKDYPQAVQLMEQCVAAYARRNWDKGNVTGTEMDVYLAGGVHFAASGNYEKSRELLLKYIAVRQPNVFEYVTRVDNQPEDFWLAMSEGYSRKAFPYQEPDEVIHRATLFADVAIAVQNSAKGYAAKAMILNNTGRYEEALQYCKAGFERSTDYGYLHYTHACILSLSGAPVNEALEAVAKALKADPALAKIMHNEADFKRISGEPGFKALFS